METDDILQIFENFGYSTSKAANKFKQFLRAATYTNRFKFYIGFGPGNWQPRIQREKNFGIIDLLIFKFYDLIGWTTIAQLQRT